jgi:hypothetical protein
MSSAIAHFLFGEIEGANTTHVVAARNAEEIGAALGAWLPRLIQRPEEAAGGHEAAARWCSDWRENAPEEEVGLISIPLDDPQMAGDEDYVHLLCRVYFNWATGGRVSRTGHAILLPEDVWSNARFNPFAFRQHMEDTRVFDDRLSLMLTTRAEDSLETGTERADYLLGAADSLFARRDTLINASPTGPLLLPWELRGNEFELLARLTAADDRRRLSMWSGRIGPSAQFQPYFDIGRGEESSAPCDRFGEVIRHLEEIVRSRDAGKLDQFSLRWPDTSGDSLLTHLRQHFWDTRPKESVPVPASNDIASDVALPKSSPKSDRHPTIEPTQKVQKVRWRFFSYKGALNILGACVVAVVLAWALYSQFLSGRDIERWLESGLESQGDEVIAVFEQGAILLQEERDEMKRKEIIDGLERLASLFRSGISSRIGSADLAGLHAMVVEARHMDAISRQAGFQLPWRTDDLLDRLHGQEAALVGRFSEVSQVKQRRAMIDELMALYGQEAHPHLQRLEMETVMFEAEYALNALRTLWRTRLVAGESLNLQEFAKEIATVRSEYPGLLAAEIEGFEQEVYAKYEDSQRKKLNQSYQAWKSQPLNEELKKSFYQAGGEYNAAMSAVPALLNVQRGNTQKMKERMESAAIVRLDVQGQGTLRIGVQKPGNWLLPPTCEYRRFTQLELSATVCVEWSEQASNSRDAHSRKYVREIPLETLLQGRGTVLAAGKVRVIAEIDPNAWPDLDFLLRN